MAYDNTNSGALFKNTKREKDTHPEYTGTINADGQEFWLSAWVKEKNGNKYFSLALKPKEAKQKSQPRQNAKPASSSGGKSTEDFEDFPF